MTCSVFNAFWQDRRYLPSLLQQELALAGRLGKKSGHGVYRWPAEILPDAALPPVMMGAESVTVRSDNVTELDDVLLLETEGETALALSIKHHRPVVVYDLCASDTVVLAAAATNAPAATDKAVHYFQQQGKKVLRIADYPGLLVWRTVAMLINEALDAVQKASPARRMSIPRCALASTIRMARWHGENAWLAAGAATAGEPATPLWRGALSPQFPAAPEGADGEAP